MALTITQQGEEFCISGNLGSTNADSFCRHLEYVLSQNKSLRINIDQVDHIDQSGVSALTRLYRYALRANLRFDIVGRGCRDLYEQFRTLGLG